ncbi:unnamed protein product [Ceutorhynchus assimilis]|uniref:Uncharacterized protein n=1 Tax=Ceutorhynchus assimilis TaxID=467358 RepID=A0A9N9MPK7_9CUCU|nr:unnamed protein product [Ceutorhynchus assimilis]
MACFKGFFKKSKSGGGSSKKSRPGKITSNPFLNFLRKFRQEHLGWPQKKVAMEGAKLWCSMTLQQRREYYDQACKIRRKRKCNPGKLTNNPFLNYLRVFRRKHCKWNQARIAIQGAKCWCRLNEKQRRKFYKQARRRSTNNSRNRCH